MYLNLIFWVLNKNKCSLISSEIRVIFDSRAEQTVVSCFWLGQPVQLFSPCRQLSGDITTKNFTVRFRSVFHSSKANLCEGFSFYSFTRATAEELPTDRSVLSSLQKDKKNNKISSTTTHRDLCNKHQKIVRRLLRSVLHTIFLFMRQLGVCA